jgi:leucine dehydrogenase
MHLVDYLTKEGAKVFITDINQDRLKKVADKSGATVVGMEEIYDIDSDIYAPCAMGATINDNTIPRLKCSIITGAANNQLKDEERHGNMLIDKGIVYAPDFVVNAGGIINISGELRGSYNSDLAYLMTEKIYDTCTSILNKAENDKITAQKAAMLLAEKRIEEVGRVKLSF